jgi:hypothetical protein
MFKNTHIDSYVLKGHFNLKNLYFTGQVIFHICKLCRKYMQTHISERFHQTLGTCFMFAYAAHVLQIFRVIIFVHLKPNNTSELRIQFISPVSYNLKMRQRESKGRIR